jgi:type II secretory pathway pseudopilin PulG
MLDRFYKDRRRAQAGTTLVELLVSVTIMAMALSLIVGTLSTGLLNATLVKRNTAAQAVLQYEMEEIQASTFSSSPAPYSECFTTERPHSPSPAPYETVCTDASFTLRADVSPLSGPTTTSQTWTITVVATGTSDRVGAPVQVLKVNR